MSFNFIIKPVQFQTISEGSITVEIPLYNDLLGEEYDVIETQNRLEAEWNSRLLDLTENLAATKGLSVWEVSKLMGQAETSTNETDRFALLGDHVTQFLKLLASRPSQSSKTYAIAAAILRRVDDTATSEIVRKLPYKFLLKLVDLATIEQLNGSYMSYEDAVAKCRVLENEVSLLKSVMGELQEKSENDTELRTILDHYYKSVDSVGNEDFSNSLNG